MSPPQPQPQLQPQPLHHRRPHTVAIEELSALLTSPDFNTLFPDLSFRRTIYDAIRKEILPTVPSTACPPLPLIVYAIRDILQPSFILQEIPNLLRLVVHLEILRNKATQDIVRLLRKDQKYRTNHTASIRLLDEQHSNRLRELTEPRRLDAQRRVYRQIIEGCSMLHIHHLWRTYSPDKDPSLPNYVIEYFPAFGERDPDAISECQAVLASRPWHYHLTPIELEQNSSVGEEAARFIVDAMQYLEDPEGFCDMHGHYMDTTFDELFPPPDADNIAAATMKFINMVTRAVDAVNSISQQSAV